ncbi:pyridoxal phosphate-dependent decarboxylase family protein [Maricaulis sp.]|uniref:pyridoxal phosphate-dependent decarboxylase family protein n=1 Tax=Maricaulis sp. TaxID=1486257 RepID=UPI002B26AFC9|nr:pyridoxal-dependent decarboxylase [Maricaulis sp.]
MSKISGCLEGVSFLGPKSENASWLRSEFEGVLDQWFDWRRALFSSDPSPVPMAMRASPEFRAEQDKLTQKVRELSEMMTGEVPKYTPRYIGHMVSELSVPALLGHFVTLLHNPNNTSRDVARVSGRVEDEAISMLASMIGFDPARAQGHFTSGGTIANFESVWRARYRMDHFLALGLCIAETTGERFDPVEFAHLGWDDYHALVAAHHITDAELRNASAVLGNPFRVAARISSASGRAWEGPVLLVPGNKHFSWLKAANVFGLGEEAFWPVELDRHGRLSLAALAEVIDRAFDAGRPVLAVVSVAGTTEAGEIDPVDGVCDLLDTLRTKGRDIWHHVDAAWGGFLCSMLGGDASRALSEHAGRALTAIRRANSVTLDPHKLGYVPYACGAFLVRDLANYANSTFAAPYIDRAAPNDRWMMTLEGSRSGSGAAAVWLTGKTLTFSADRFGEVMAGTLESRAYFEQALVSGSERVRILKPIDSNILCFSLAEKGEGLHASNARTSRVYEAFAADPEFAVSKTKLAVANYRRLIDSHLDQYGGQADCGSLVLIRCVFMNPFWRDPEVRAALMPRFLERLETHMN